MNLYELTKEELIARCKRLQSENTRLQIELDELSNHYLELENQITEKEGGVESVLQRLR